jgi:hypothetical protein
MRDLLAGAAWGVIFALAWCAVSVPAAFAIGAWMRRKHPAPAAGQRPGPGPSPVPGQPVPLFGPQVPPGLHAPAPGSRHGGIDYTLRVWRCGRIRLWNARGQLAGQRECACGASGTDWDAELRDEVKRRQP